MEDSIRHWRTIMISLDLKSKSQLLHLPKQDDDSLKNQGKTLTLNLEGNWDFRDFTCARMVKVLLRNFKMTESFRCLTKEFYADLSIAYFKNSNVKISIKIRNDFTVLI
jgi:hypothetical protein